MIKLLKKHHRWRDYFNIKEPEVYLSIFLVLVIMLVINELNVYRDFDVFSDAIQNILLYLSAGMIGLIGVSLSGVAIITGLFSKKNVDTIERINGDGTFEKIMSSFLFLAMNCAIYIFFAFILILVITSNKPIVTYNWFYTIAIVTIYFAAFNILYTVSLVGNCIRIFAIRNQYDEIGRKDFFDEVNEVRIDYILKGMVEKYNISEKEFLHDLEAIVVNSNIDNKEEVIDYYYRHYIGKGKNE